MTSASARPFGAVLTAMVTPFAADGSVDIDAAVRVARHLVDNGHDGLVLNGTTGESPTTHAPEKAAVVAAVVEAVGDRATIVAGAGSNDTAHAIRMAQQAADAGADGLLVVTPYYSRPSQEGVARHIEAVADSTSLPVMIYDVPGRTGVRVKPETLVRLAQHDRIVAIKDATGDWFTNAQATQVAGLAWYCGDDGAFLTTLALGAAGIVSVVGHVAGNQLAAVVAAIDAGDLVTARRIFFSIAPAIEAVNGPGFQTVSVKAAAQLTGLLDSRRVRGPHVEATEAEVAIVRSGLVAAGLLPA